MSQDHVTYKQLGSCDLRAPIFEMLWGSLEEPCWSVKVLEREREVVKELIQKKLGPFLVRSEAQESFFHLSL